MQKKLLAFLPLLTLALAPIAHAQECQECYAECGEALAAPEYPEIQLVAESGFLGVLDHVIQFSNAGTLFSYRTDGGQNVLFNVARFSAAVNLDPRHRLVFLYQPLELKTQDILTRDLRVDDTVFPAGTPMAFDYSFPFYRLSYLYDFDEKPGSELAFGASLQIRNATIIFSDLAGTALTRQADIGPVPLLKFSVQQPLGGKWWWGAELDGIYAPVSYLNGSDEEIVGALLDASGRLGLTLSDASGIFLNVRYLGGGAVGTDESEQGPGDGYVKNWLHFFIVSLGYSLRLF